MALDEITLKKTLQDIDGEDWGEPTYPSYLVTEYHRLRQVPLGKLTVENLRLLIGQVQISLEYFDYLIPLALEYLQSNPWAQGVFYEGDLLENVLLVPESFWHSHADLKYAMDHIVHKALAQASEGEPIYDLEYDANVLELLHSWEGSLKPGC